MSENDSMFFKRAFAVFVLINICSLQPRLWLCVILLSIAGAFVFISFRKNIEYILKIGFKLYNLVTFILYLYQWVDIIFKNRQQQLYQQWADFRLSLVRVFHHIEESIFSITEIISLNSEALENAQSVLTPVLERGRRFFRTIANFLQESFQSLVSCAKQLSLKIFPDHHARESE